MTIKKFELARDGKSNIIPGSQPFPDNSACARMQSWNGGSAPKAKQVIDVPNDARIAVFSITPDANKNTMTVLVSEDPGLHSLGDPALEPDFKDGKGAVINPHIMLLSPNKGSPRKIYLFTPDCPADVSVSFYS